MFATVMIKARPFAKLIRILDHTNILDAGAPGSRNRGLFLDCGRVGQVTVFHIYMLSSSLPAPVSYAIEWYSWSIPMRAVVNQNQTR